MKRTVFSLLLLIILLDRELTHAQCPYMKAALVKGCGASEGPNEFVVVNTGTTSLAITTAKVDYAVSVTSWTVDGSTAGMWTAKTGTGVITNSSGTLTTISSGSVPANRPWVIIPANLSVNFDLAIFGADVYLSYYDPAKAFSFSSSGNFANSGTGVRTFTLTTPSCSSTASYAPNSLIGAAGAGIIWNSAGVAKYVNTGCNAIVLPLSLSAFNGQIAGGKVVLSWQLDNAEGYTSVVIEQSLDGIVFDRRGEVPCFGNTRTYRFTDDVGTKERLLYRLRLIRTDGVNEYTGVLALSAAGGGMAHVKLSPNPVTDELHLQLYSKSGEIAEIELWQPSGMRILSRDLPLSGGENALTIPVSSLPAGLYFIRVLKGNEVWQERWIKQ